MGVFKNEVGRPTNETIRKRRILKILVVLFVLIILFVGGYFINNLFNKQNGIIEENNVSNEKMAIELISVFDSVNKNFEKFGYFYKEDRNVGNLDNDVIIITAVQNLPSEYSSEKYTKDEVNESVKKIFGDIEYKDESIESYCYVYNYDSAKELYTTDNGCSGDGPFIHSEITDTKINSDKLTIINKIAISNFDYDSGTTTLYKDLNESVVVKEGYSFDEGIKKYLDKLYSYEWTFIKNNNGDYIFESVKKLNKDNQNNKYSVKQAFDKFVEIHKLTISEDGEAYDLDALKSINCKKALTAIKKGNVDSYNVTLHEFTDEESAIKEFNKQKEYQKNAGEGVIEVYERNILSEKTEKYYDVEYDVFEVYSLVEDIEDSKLKRYDYYYSVRIGNYYISLFSTSEKDLYKDMKNLKQELNILLDIK